MVNQREYGDFQMSEASAAQANMLGKTATVRKVLHVLWRKHPDVSETSYGLAWI